MSETRELLREIATEIRDAYPLAGQDRAKYVADCIDRVLARHEPEKLAGDELVAYGTVSAREWNRMVAERDKLRGELKQANDYLFTATANLEELRLSLRILVREYCPQLMPDADNLGKVSRFESQDKK